MPPGPTPGKDAFSGGGGANLIYGNQGPEMLFNGQDNDILHGSVGAFGTPKQ